MTPAPRCTTYSFDGRWRPTCAVPSPGVDGLSVIPATIDLAGAEVHLLGRTAREHVLARALQPIVDDYDVVMIDCPPSLGVLTINGLTAAEVVLVPLQCEALSHRGVGQLLETIEDVRQFANEKLSVLGVIPTMYDGRTTHARKVLGQVEESYGLRVFDPPVPKSVRFAEAPELGRSVLAACALVAGRGGLPGAWPRRSSTPCRRSEVADPEGRKATRSAGQAGAVRGALEPWATGAGSRPRPDLRWQRATRREASVVLRRALRQGRSAGRVHRAVPALPAGLACGAARAPHPPVPRRGVAPAGSLRPAHDLPVVSQTRLVQRLPAPRLNGSTRFRSRPGTAPDAERR